MPWKLVLIGQMCCKSNFLMFSKTLTIVLLMYCFLKNTLSTRSTKESKIVVVISSIIGKISTNTQLLKVTRNTDNVSSKCKSQTITTNYYSQNHPTQYSNYYYKKEHRLFKSEERFLVHYKQTGTINKTITHYYWTGNTDNITNHIFKTML